MGNLAGLVSPTMVGVIREATGSFTAALLFLAAALLLGAAVALLFGRVSGIRAKKSHVITREGG
jgi:cyanate permease